MKRDHEFVFIHRRLMIPWVHITCVLLTILLIPHYNIDVKPAILTIKPHEHCSAKFLLAAWFEKWQGPDTGGLQFIAGHCKFMMECHFK